MFLLVLLRVLMVDVVEVNVVGVHVVIDVFLKSSFLEFLVLLQFYHC